MFIDNMDDANVINFEEQEQDVNSYTNQQHKFPNVQSDDYRPSSPPKVTVNREFHKNLGQNQAQYAEDRKFDVNKVFKLAILFFRFTQKALNKITKEQKLLSKTSPIMRIMVQ